MKDEITDMIDHFPFFSIIVATKNRVSLLQECIDSVLAQTYTNFELIIVDDHSTDTTKEMVSAIEDKRIIFKTNMGVERSAARNTGIEAARGEYLCILDDDDFIEPCYLIDFWNKLNELSFPKSTVVRSGFKYIYSDGRKTKPSPNFDSSYKDSIDFVTKIMCHFATLCVHRSLFDGALFDIRYPHWQDTHLILRILVKADLVQLDSHNYCYRIHPRMGSLQKVDEAALVEKCAINVAPMDDIFMQYKIISKQRLNWMKSRKYLEYGTRSMTNKFYYFRKSVTSCVHPSLYKQYYFFFKSLVS
jgi:glycosyltransferase involved in cell wall biosynthesis